MADNYCFFEDSYLENFHPLTLTRPVYDLRSGILTLGEKWMVALGEESALEPSGILREHLSGVFKDYQIQESQKFVTWINPRIIPTKDLAQKVKNLKENRCLFFDYHLIAARISADMHRQW